MWVTQGLGFFGRRLPSTCRATSVSGWPCATSGTEQEESTEVCLWHGEKFPTASLSISSGTEDLPWATRKCSCQYPGRRCVIFFSYSSGISTNSAVVSGGFRWREERFPLRLDQGWHLGTFCSLRRSWGSPAHLWALQSSRLHCSTPGPNTTPSTLPLGLRIPQDSSLSLQMFLDRFLASLSVNQATPDCSEIFWIKIFS